MLEPVISIAAAALIAGTVTLAITAAPAAIGLEPTQAHDAIQAPLSAKAHRLHVPVKGAACSVYGWPDFEPKCQFDVREPAGKARAVRIIALR